MRSDDFEDPTTINTTWQIIDDTKGAQTMFEAGMDLIPFKLTLLRLP